MPTEIKSRRNGGVRIEAVISPTIKKKLNRALKKLNISQAQFIRDLIQKALKEI